MTDANSVSTFLSLRETFVCYADILGFRPGRRELSNQGKQKNFSKASKPPWVTLTKRFAKLKSCWEQQDPFST